MRRFSSVAELQAEIGKEVAVSDWLEISQERVNAFAHATDDAQWIHVDVERAKRESPFGGPVAHGFLTLSLLPKFLRESISLPLVGVLVNYGVNRLRFPAPLPVGGKLRARFALQSLQSIEDAVQMEWLVTFEREGEKRPVCVAEAVLRQYA